MLQLDESWGKWQIGEPNLKYFGTRITMTYTVNALIPEESVGVILYSDSGGCAPSSKISDGDYGMVPNLIFADIGQNATGQNTTTVGQNAREVTIDFTIDPAKVQKSPFWDEQGDDQFFISYCVGLALYLGNAAEPGSTLVAELDTSVNIQVDLKGDFGVEFDVAPADINEEAAQQIYYVEGFICDENNKELVASIPGSQGSKLRVCVKPTDKALADGVYMRAITAFTFIRSDLPEGMDPITQVAVRNAKSNGLTELTCLAGSELCHFETILRADFYAIPGSVRGFGEAWLQVSVIFICR
jgi:hypothetical protein